MKKITAIGSVVLDIILVSDEKKLELGSKIEVKDFAFSLGGGAFNASATFKKLGLDPKIYFHLGKDFLGRIIESELRKIRINYRIFRHKKSTTFSVVFLPARGERLIFVFRGPESEFTFKELKSIKPTPYIYITPGKTPPHELLNYLKLIRNKTKLIGINPSKVFLQDKNSFKALYLTDIVFINEEESRIFTKDKKSDIITLGRKIYKKLGLKILVITLGNKGSLVFFGDKIYKAGIFKIKKLVDKTGAGDAFSSAFFGCLVLNEKINEENVVKAIIWGTANSSSVIQELGAQNGILNKDDYKKFENKNLKIKILQ